MPNELKNIFLDHKGKLSDKWAIYINAWDEILSPYRADEINLLEIGIHNGGSLEIWSQYFPKAKHIIGCDVNPDCERLKYKDPRISVIIGDANTDDVEKAVSELAPGLDVIIDDGSHKSGDIIRSFTRYFNHLNDNGVYLIEDLHTSYWGPFEGGLFNPYSAMSFFKRLVDITNFEHWRSDQSREQFLLPYQERYGVALNEFLLCHIHAIKFINSLCIIHKRSPQENRLGNRMVVGSEEQVSQGELNLDGITIHDIAIDIKDDSHLNIFSLLNHNDSLSEDVNKLNQTVQRLEADLAQRDQLIQQQQAAIAEQDRAIQDLNADVVEGDQVIQQQQAAMAEQDQTIQHQQAEIDNRDQTIQDLQIEMAEQSQSIQKLAEDVAEQHQVIQQLRTDVAERDQTIQALNMEVAKQKEAVLFYALSKSWRFTRPLRKLRKFLMGKRNA